MPKNTNIRVLLSHLGSIDETDLQNIEEHFKDFPIVLQEIRSDKDYDAYFEDFSLQVYYSISSSLLKALIYDEKGLKIWKSLKTVLAYTRNKLKYGIYSNIRSGIINLTPLRFGLHVVLDSNTSYNFELSRVLDDKLFDESLDRILIFLSDQSPNKQYDLPFYVRYSAKKKQWESESFEAYLLKKSRSN